MATQKKKTIGEKLADRKIVEFNRGLIESLDQSEVQELIEDYIAHPVQSIGQRFVAAMESIYRKPVIAEGDNVVDVNVTVDEVLAVINGNSTANNGVIIIGRRSDKKVFYLRWSSQMQETGEVKIRDPFSRNGTLERYVEAGETKYIGAQPYDAQVADADGALVIEQDLYVMLCLAWPTGEAQPSSLAEVNRRLLESETMGKELKASDVAGYFPQAHQRLIQLKGEKRGRDWARFVDSLMDAEASDSGSMPPFGGGSNIVVGHRGVIVRLTLERWHELGMSIRGPLVNELTKLQIMGNIAERLTLFNGGLRRFQASMDFNVSSRAFASQILVAVERFGDSTLWEELMRSALSQPDTSPELRYMIEAGEVPKQGGDVFINVYNK